MAFLNSIEQLRSVSWGNKYLWDIQFNDSNLLAPFNTWFPALDVEEELAHVDSLSWEAGLTSFRVPQKTKSLSLKITFIDDNLTSLLTWITIWQNQSILNSGQYVSTVSTAARMVTILKLNSQRQTIVQTAYWVYPDGTITFMGNSEGGLQTYAVNFVIVGKV